MFTVSVNPSTLCNFNCNFCYLSPLQLKNKKRVDINLLKTRLSEVNSYNKITHIDLYGGELLLLPESYIIDLLSVLEKFTDNINIITNLSRPVKDWMLKDNITLSVSWDYQCRERWDNVLQNIIATPKNIHILMVASECMVNWSIEKMYEAHDIFDRIQNIKSVEIKPYSTNQANAQPVTFIDYENLVKKWLNIYNTDHSYEFVNDRLINNVLSLEANSYSDDHVYINPNGNFAVLTFDDNDNEQFTELHTLSEYHDWTIQEKERIRNNEFCNTCSYKAKCLSEHLREVTNINESCNGFKHLLDWYDDNFRS